MISKSVHKEDIKGALRKRYGTLIAFEQAHDLPTQSVKDVLRGRASARVEQAIADDLELPLHRLFPGRYVAAQAGDSSLKRDNKRTKRNAHRLSAEAR
ncbi:helix-turn-helix domain-containing protein [Brevundimonas sp.]|uniref:helix-turn-helix domain-containing protein n=1 Tax=Brevundimonas sp. TaxID=1871086 RepID=UPI003D6D6178